MVNERSQTGEAPVTLQSEAGDEHLEGDFCIEVGELGPVEIKT